MLTYHYCYSEALERAHRKAIASSYRIAHPSSQPHPTGSMMLFLNTAQYVMSLDLNWDPLTNEYP